MDGAMTTRAEQLNVGEFPRAAAAPGTAMMRVPGRSAPPPAAFAAPASTRHHRGAHGTDHVRHLPFPAGLYAPARFRFRERAAPGGGSLGERREGHATFPHFFASCSLRRLYSPGASRM